MLRHKANFASQEGEDGIIQRILELISVEQRICVEFGAWDGCHYSNCRNLIVNWGWAAVMIEADPKKFAELHSTYAANQAVLTINRFVDFEGVDSLDSILAECEVPPRFGLLSIDIDGNDFHIWESLRRFAPEIVVIEFNPTIPNDVCFVQEKSFDVNHGSSLLAMIMLGREKGYELAACTSFNAIFVRKERFGALGIENNFIGFMYRPVQDGRIFQGFDGSIHVVGMDRLHWTGTPVSSKDFQLLPGHRQVWSDAQKKP